MSKAPLSGLKAIQTLIDELRSKQIQEISVIVGADGAAMLMREFFAIGHVKDLAFTSREDELFVYKGVKVLVRSAAPVGQAVVMDDPSVPKPGCCDQTIVQTVFLCCSRGRA